MSGPKAGTHLDAAMAVVEQEVNERIDRIQDRRRRLSRAVVGVLLVGTITGGAATAAALTALSPEPAPVAEPLAVELHCVDGADASAAAYFTVRYRVPVDDASAIDEVGVCSAARNALSDSLEISESEPAELLEVAVLIVQAAVPDGRTPEVTVEEASFGPPVTLSVGAVAHGSCERESDGRIVVLALPTEVAPHTPAGWASRCMLTDGYRLAGGEQ